MRLSRVELRERYRGLLDLVNRWDPIGVLGDPDWPRGEYECVVGALLRRLEEGAPVADVAGFLHHEFTGHFGLAITPAAALPWAAEATAWYAARWPGTGSIPRGDAG